MLDFIREKKNCVGCTACFAVCPIHCIEMKQDEEGFLYPEATEECFHCGKCQKVCPILNYEQTEKTFVQKAFAALTKNKSIWMRSASGGAFSEICRAWGDEETMYVGAAWDGLNVHHICVIGYQNILPLCKSKYIASNMENCFILLRKHLLKGKKAVFCGTPCQVAGLKKYLNREYDNLLLIDLICHGVGSLSVFKACIDEMSEQFGGKIISYEFRTKRGISQLYNKLETHQKRGKQFYIKNDPYIQLFLSQKCLRPSCGQNCRFRTEKRQGDITIADFKGLSNVFEELSGSKKNYSSIIINSAKGATLTEPLNQKMKVLSCDIEDIKKYNPLFFKQTWFSDERDKFFADFREDKRKAIKSWCLPATECKKTLKRRVWDVIPDNARKILLKKLAGNGSMESEYSSCSLSKIMVQNDKGKVDNV